MITKDKILPYDINAEQSLIGVLLLDPKAVAKVADKINQNYFFSESNSVIYQAVLDLYSKNKPTDMISVANELKKRNNLELAGGSSYLAEVMDIVPSISNIEMYAEIVAEKALRRNLIDLGCNISEKAFDDTLELDELINQVEEGMVDVSKKAVRKRIFGANEVVSEVFDEIQSIKGVSSIKTGFRNLDSIVKGFKNSDLVVLAARPSVGKTSLALNFAMNAAKKGVPVLFFSLEMSAKQIGLKLLSLDSMLSMERISNFDLSNDEKKMLSKSFGRVSELPIYIEDTGYLSVLEMKSAVREMQAKKNIKLVIIDYLQLMKLNNKRIENRFQEVSAIVRQIKGFAKDMDLPIVALSQLSRAVEQRNDKRPYLSDLRETGELEQTADVVMFLHRDDYYDTNTTVSSDETSETEVIVSKHRNGPTGTVKLAYKRDISRFMSLEV